MKEATIRVVNIGDFVETKHNVSGILSSVKDTPHGRIAFIATADGRIFYCPISDLKNCKYKE